MLIGVDLDGVVYEFESAYCYMLNEYRGYNLNWHNWNSWDYPQRMVAENDRKWMEEVAAREGLYRYGHIEKGAISNLGRIRALGHEVVFITHRPPAAVQDTIDFLSYARLGAPVHILTRAEPKRIVECDVYIDDKPQTITDIIFNTHKQAILYDQPWNQGTQPGEGSEPRFHRAKGWHEVVEVIRAI